MKKWLLMPFVAMLLAFSTGVMADPLSKQKQMEQERQFKQRQIEHERLLLDYQKRYRKMVQKMDTKLNQDPYKTDTYAEFVFLGLSYCFDEMLPYKESFGNTYINGMNSHKELFPRLIELESLRKELKDFHKKHFTYTEGKSFLDNVQSCQAVYNLENKTLRKKYEQILNNPKYRENWQFDY